MKIQNALGEYENLTLPVSHSALDGLYVGVKGRFLPDPSDDEDTTEREPLLLDKEKPSPKRKEAAARVRDVRVVRAAVQSIKAHFSPEVLAILLVYLVQGGLYLSDLAMKYYLKDTLKLQPAQVTGLQILYSVPWGVKPLYGFVTDSFPIFGYRRRPYLVMCGLTGSAAFFLLAVIKPTLVGVVMCQILAMTAIAFGDVVADSLVVQRARDEPVSATGTLQTMCWSTYFIGQIVTAYFSGYLVEELGIRPVFAITAAFPLLVMLAAFLIREERTAKQLQHDGSSSSSRKGSKLQQMWQQICQQGKLLGKTIARREVLYPCLFLLTFQAAPIPDSAMFFFFTNQLHFSPKFMGTLQLAGAVAALAGMLLYNAALKQRPIRMVMLCGILLSAVLYSSQLLLISRTNLQLGISDKVFAFGDYVVLGGISQALSMPILVMAARLCPEGLEGTLFALLMTMLNVSTGIGSGLGAGLTQAFGVTAHNFHRLFWLVLVCNLCMLLPLPLLPLLPKTLDIADQDQPAAKGDTRSTSRADDDSVELVERAHSETRLMERV